MLRRRWPRSSKVLMALAVVLGTFAFVTVQGYARRVEALHPDVGPTVPVVVAATRLARGTVLSEEVLRVSEIPKAYAPPGAIASPSAAKGRVLTADVAAGETLTSSRLSSPAVGPVAALVPNGLRALVVPTDLPAGTIRAGDRVDVYATYGGGRSYTELAAGSLEVLRVLASGPSAGGIAPAASTGSATGGVSLVLLVDLDAVERLAYARTFGALQVAILGPEAATGTS